MTVILEDERGVVTTERDQPVNRLLGDMAVGRTVLFGYGVGMVAIHAGRTGDLTVVDNRYGPGPFVEAEDFTKLNGEMWDTILWNLGYDDLFESLWPWLSTHCRRLAALNQGRKPSTVGIVLDGPCSNGMNLTVWEF